MLIDRQGRPATRFSTLNTDLLEPRGEKVGTSDSERAELIQLLSCEKLGEHTLSPEAADGYLTACLIGPQVVRPNAYLEEIFGQDELLGGFEAPSAHVERIVALLLRRAAEIVERTGLLPHEIEAAGGDARVFEPLLSDARAAEHVWPIQLNEEGDRLGHWAGKDWSEGFLMALRKDPLWEPMVADPETAQWLSPMVLMNCGFNPDTDPTVAAASAQPYGRQDTDLMAGLGQCVWLIRQHWDDQNVGEFGNGNGMPASSTKVGRNEPCPCGSGKKYKKCCGA